MGAAHLVGLVVVGARPGNDRLRLSHTALVSSRDSLRQARPPHFERRGRASCDPVNLRKLTRTDAPLLSVPFSGGILCAAGFGLSAGNCPTHDSGVTTMRGFR